MAGYSANSRGGVAARHIVAAAPAGTATRIADRPGPHDPEYDAGINALPYCGQKPYRDHRPRLIERNDP
jgi:hypothetical protein